MGVKENSLGGLRNGTTEVGQQALEGEVNTGTSSEMSAYIR